MRILSVIYDLDIGGTQRAAVDFANAYAGLGHESILLALEDAGTRRKDLSPHVELITIAEVLDDTDSPPLDLIHIHGHGLSRELVGALRERYPSATLVEQNVFAKINPWNEYLDRTFVFSDWCLFRYAQEVGSTAAASRVPNPIDTSGFWSDGEAGREARRRLGIPSTAFVVGRVGQPQTYKWSPMLITAFNEWASECPDAWLLLVGPPDEILDAIAHSPSRERITVINRVEGDQELRALYSAMNVFGHVASQGETFGYVLVEAALCEVPSITLSTPWADNSQGEVVVHGTGGLVVTTPRGFVQALRKLSTEPDMARALGRNARKSAIERYDSRVVARNALDAVLSNRTDESPSTSDLARNYARAIDPPGPLRSLLFRTQRFGFLAVVSGVHSIMWWLRGRANRMGISRNMWKPGRRA